MYNHEKAQRRADIIVRLLTVAAGGCIVGAIIFALSGCYTNGTQGFVEIPVALLPDEMKNDDVRAMLESEPGKVITMQFDSFERLVGGANVQGSKKDVGFLLEMSDFFRIEATGGRSIAQAEADAAPLVQAAFAGLAQGVMSEIGVPRVSVEELQPLE